MIDPWLSGKFDNVEQNLQHLFLLVANKIVLQVSEEYCPGQNGLEALQSGALALTSRNKKSS